MSKRYSHAYALAGLLLAAPVASWAQARLGLQAQIVTGTYTDLGTAGSAIATASTDDANSAAQNIGFTFTYGGVAFTQFVLNTNGLVRLGAAPPSAAAAHSGYSQSPDFGPINSAAAADVNLIMPFNFDLEAGSSAAEYRVATTGTAPNRVCTVQWKNVSDKQLVSDPQGNSTLEKQYANFSFQVKLYEGSNQIEFVYGTATANTGITAGPKYATVGLKGARNTIASSILLNKASLQTWASAIYSSGRQQPSVLDNAFNFRADVRPTAGFTVRFTTCTPATVTAFPYQENFDNANSSQLICSSASDDSNSDGFPWSVAYTAIEGASPALTYIYNYNSNTAADDWYYTPGLLLRAGYRYQLQFSYHAGDSDFPESLEVKYGTAATPASQTSTLFSNANIINDTYATTTAAQVLAITPSATGTYYIGFHATSAADQFALLVDDIQVTETQILGVRNAANNVFTAEASPVPFGESLNLTLNTLKPGPLHLTLRDALGRTLRQSTATAATGTSTVAVPEVGSLPGGVYFLTVEQGGQSQVLRVSHR